MRRLISAPSRPDTLSATTHGLGSLVSPCMNEIVASYSRTARNGPKLSKHSRLAFVFIKNRKTSAVSTTDWMVETQLCKLRGTSETFVGRAHILRFIFYYIVLINLRYGCYYSSKFHTFYGRSSARVLYFILMKDIGWWLPWMPPGSTGQFFKTILCIDTI